MAKNSKAKGNRGEKAVVELLRKYWGTEEFTRNWMGGSGAVGTQLAGMGNKVPKHLLEAMTADVVTPLDFPWTIESKCYAEVSIYEVLRNPEGATLSTFWKQIKGDSLRVGKMPMVLFKEDRKQYYVLFAESDLLSVIKKHNLNIPCIRFEVEGDVVCMAAWKTFSEQLTKEIVKLEIPYPR